MSNVLDGLEEAGKAIKEGVRKALGGEPEQPNPTDQPSHVAAPASPTDCGPTGCENEEEPVRA